MNLIAQIKKHNSITDAKTGNLSVVAEKLINALYHTWESEGHDKFTVSLTDLQKLLKMENNKDSRSRVLSAVSELRAELEFRDFKIKGREVQYMTSSFLQKGTIWKDNKNYIDIEIDGMVIEALKQKVGYTKIDLQISQQFRSKYAFKLYELYLRYKNKPNKTDNSLGIIEESLNKLNERFGTTYKSPSPILRNLEKAAIKIKEITGDDIYIYFNKITKNFVISWQKEDMLPSACRVPAERIREFAEWYFEYLPKNQKDTVFDNKKYIGGLIEKIKKDQLKGLDEKYRGMMQIKYSLNPDDYYDNERSTYMNFRETKSLFD